MKHKKMTDRLKKLAMLYTLPLLSMCLVPFMKTIQIQNEPLGVFGLMVAGFIIGMMVEGFLLVASATVALLMGELD